MSSTYLKIRSEPKPSFLHFSLSLASRSIPSVLIQLVLLRSLLQLPVTANVVPSSLILLTLMMEAILSSKASVLTRATRRNIPEDGKDGILHSHRRENLKSYIALTGWNL
jgi:hypothetical protein